MGKKFVANKSILRTRTRVLTLPRRTEAILSFFAGEPPDPRAEERWKRRAPGQQRALEVMQQTKREEEAEEAAYIREETERANQMYDLRSQRTGKSMLWSRKKDKKGNKSNTEEDRPPPLPKDSKDEQFPISDLSAIEAQPEQRHNAGPSRSNRGSPKKDPRPPTEVSAPPVDSVMDRPHPRYNSRMQGEHTEPQRSTTPNNDGPQIIAELAGQELSKHPSWPAATSRQQHDSDVSRPPRSRYSDYDEHDPPPRRSSLPPPLERRRPVGAESTGRQRRSRARNHENARPEVSFQAANNLDFGPTLFRSDTGGSDPNIAKRDEERPNDLLKIMCKEYHGLKADHSSLEFEGPFTLAQVAVASQSVINAYKTLSLEVQDFENSITLKDKDYESLQRSHTKLQKKLESEGNWLAEQITQLTRESAKKEGRIEQLNEECEKRDGQMKELRKEHQVETRTLIENGNAQIQLLQNEAKALEDQHEQELKTHAETVRQNFAQSLKDLQDALIEEQQAHTSTVEGYEEQLEKLKTDHVKETSNLEIWYKEQNTDLTNQLLNQKGIADAELQKAKEAAEKELQRQLAIAEAKIEAQILKHEDEIKKAKEAHAEEMTQTIYRYRAQDTKLRSGFESQRQKLQLELQTEKENHEKAIGKANEDWGKELQKKQTELEGLKEIHEVELKETDQDWRKLVQEKQTTLDQIDAVYGEKMRKANEEWEKRLQNKQTELDGIDAVHEEVMRKSNEEWERRLQGKQTELDGVRTAHVDALRTVNEGWEKLLQDKQTELNGVISSCKNRIGKLQDSYEARLANYNLGLRATNEQLKNALVERDHFKVISDREVANVFQDISSYVEEFAGEPWDRSLQDTWPFPSAAFEELENDRRTRTHLIQNTLWVILYEMIFCTPFRVFGEEGVKLDMQWLDKYGQGKLLIFKCSHLLK
jgi:hypothetical protein